MKVPGIGIGGKGVRSAQEGESHWNIVSYEREVENREDLDLLLHRRNGQRRLWASEPSSFMRREKGDALIARERGEEGSQTHLGRMD